MYESFVRCCSPADGEGGYFVDYMDSEKYHAKLDGTRSYQGIREWARMRASWYHNHTENNSPEAEGSYDQLAKEAHVASYMLDEKTRDLRYEEMDKWETPEWVAETRKKYGARLPETATPLLDLRLRLQNKRQLPFGFGHLWVQHNLLVELSAQKFPDTLV